MGSLPQSKIAPASPFQVVGVDYAGSFLCKSGNLRKATITKAYVAVFVCFATKDTHLDVVSDLTSEAFTAAFRRFFSQRGYPKTVCSDNGTNFVGACRDMKEFYQLIYSDKAKNFIYHFTSRHQIHLVITPSGAPHFGGLCESSVKSMKRILGKITSPHKFTF